MVYIVLYSEVVYSGELPNPTTCLQYTMVYIVLYSEVVYSGELPGPPTCLQYTIVHCTDVYSILWCTLYCTVRWCTVVSYLAPLPAYNYSTTTEGTRGTR